jgi:hypothetical protein
MSAPDPVNTGLTIAAALQVAKQGQDLIAAALGHPGESLGTMVGSWGRRRIQNAEAVTAKANLILLNLGEPVRDIPFSTGFPILEAASLQENPSMQDIWANLLTNAADSCNPNSVSAAFAQILKELSGPEVRFLERVYEGIENPPPPFAGRPRTEFYFSELVRIYQIANGLSGQDRGGFNFGIELLMRHQIFKEDSTPLPIKIADRMRRLPTPQIPDALPVQMTHSYRITTLGMHFIAACRPPSPSSK